MTRKSRFFALAGLMLALAIGTTAVRAWSRGSDSPESPCESSSPCHSGGGCPALIRKAPHINKTCATRKKTAVKKEGCEGCCCEKVFKLKAAHKHVKKDASKGSCGCPSSGPAADCRCKSKNHHSIQAHPGCCVPFGAPGCCVPFNAPVAPPFPGMPAPPCWTGPVPPMPDILFPPPPPAMPICAPAGECKQYTVNMKLVECRSDDEEKVVASPSVTVCEHHTAQVSSGLSHAHLWKKGVPADEMGHEGHHITVTVAPAHAGQVCLTCWLWTSELTHNAGGHPAMQESRISTTRCVKLGEVVKFHCDRVCGNEKVRCCLEVVVQEGEEEKKGSNKSVGCPPSDTWCDSAAAGFCPQVEVGEGVAPFEGCRMIEGAVQACWTAPSPTPAGENRPAALEFSVIEDEAGCGKLHDCYGCCHHLRVCCDGASMTCEKMKVKLAGSKSIDVSIQDEQVHVVGTNLKAQADRVSTDREKHLILEGNVKVHSSTDGVEVKTGKVVLNLDE